MIIIRSLLARLAAFPLLVQSPSPSHSSFSLFSRSLQPSQPSSASPALAISSSLQALVLFFPSLTNPSASSIPVLHFSSVSPATSPSWPILSILLLPLSWP